jgi:hypothetical protein
MFKVLPKVERFGTAIIGPRSQELVSVFAQGVRGSVCAGQSKGGAVGYGGVSIKS